MLRKKKVNGNGSKSIPSTTFAQLLFTASILAIITSTAQGAELFPSTLDTLGYSGSGDFHLHGLYTFNMTAGGLQVPVNLKAKESYCRLSMSNLTGYDATVRLAPSSGSSSTGLVSDCYNHLTGVLPEGRYVLSFAFKKQVHTSTNMNTNMNTNTDTLLDAYVEFAIADAAVQKERSASFATAHCPQTPTSTYPIIDFGPLREHNSVHFDSASGSSPLEYVVFPSASETFAHAWGFEIPSHSDNENTRAATITATLRTDFLTGGFLQLVLQANVSDVAAPQMGEGLVSCVRGGRCLVGTRGHAGELTLRGALAPGRYALWVHWPARGYTSDATPACVPIGVALDIEDAPVAEDALTCGESQALPGDLDPLFAATGELYYAQRVLVGAAQFTRSANFSLAAESLVRVYVHEHPLDLDVDIADAATGEVLAYGMRASGPEVVVARLAPGRYRIAVTSFSLAKARLCDAFDMEVAIQPVAGAGAARDGVCADKKVTRSPALEELTALGASAAATAHAAEREYVFVYDGAFKQRAIVAKDFKNAGAARRFRARLASNFVLSDITMQIMDKRTREIIYPDHDTRNAHTLDVFLDPNGEYTFSILTGGLQSTRPPGSEYFPPCAPYTFALDVDLAASPEGGADPAAAKCAAYRALPQSLNTPEFLGTAHSVHIAETFRMPNVSASALAPSQRVDFALERESYVRVFVPKHHVDIDVYLLNGTDTIRAAMSFLADESLSYLLPPGNNYAIRFEFIHYAHPGEEPPCYLFPVELSITPWDSTTAPSRCPAGSADNLPSTTNFVPEAVAAGETTETWVSEGTYWAQRAGVARPLNITFTLARLSAFRAILRSDFAYGQLSLKLIDTDDSSAYSAPVTPGFGSAEIPVESLPPGTYSLIIYEPYSLAGLPEEVLSACVRFTLTVAIGPSISSSSSSGDEIALCEYTKVPKTLNTPGMLSFLNGYKARLAGTYLVNLNAQRDYIPFTVDEDMLYRVYVPETRHVDVDIYFRKGTPTSSGEIVNHCAGIEEEMLYGKIAKGDYYFQLEYLNLGTTAPGDTCVGFPIVIALEPASAFSGDQYAKECKATFPPEKATLDTPVSQTYAWNPTAFEGYAAEVAFTVDTDTARFDAELRYEFVPAGLSFRLTGSVRSGLLEIDADLDAAPGSGGNRLYMGSYLARGNYTLTIEDLAGRANADAVKCAEYQLLYTIDTKVRASPDACMEVERLPTDLYSDRGGSAEYGGPQRADGTVLVVGEHFFVNSRPEYASQWTRFNVTEPSFVRVFTRTQAPNDVDVYLYRNRTQPFSLVDGSVSLGEYESALWHLPDTKPTSYDLKTQFFAIDYDTPCNYFRWAAAVKTARALATDLLCPATLPAEVDRVPPATIQVLAGAQTRIISDEYIFTKEFVEAHSGATTAAGTNTFRYSMLLDISAATGAGATVMANLRYNFVTNDFKVRVRDYASGEVLATAAASSIPSALHYSRFNFRAVLRARLAPGKYYLTIEEGGLSGKAELTDLVRRYCYPFAFELTATPEGGSSGGGGGGGGGSNITVDGPIIESVTPGLLTSFEPCEDLYIQIAFSDVPATIPRGLSESTGYINEHRTMYLEEVNGTAKGPAFPLDLAVFEEDGMTLTLRYSNERFNHTSSASYTPRSYKLVIDVAQLKDATGRAFTDPSIVDYIYSMAACDCTGDHGVCRVVAHSEACLQCTCAGHWTGARCEACEAGYHRSGDKCVRDNACTADACNGHGACDDSTGKVRCMCDVGYATSDAAGMCGECAFGYTGYPHCAANSSDERAGVCNVAYLPRTLNAVAHLGWTGEADLSGEYYIDTGAKLHNTYFNLDRDTILRVYAEPNRVDIDLWLYELKSDGETIDHVIDYTMTFNGAEVLYKVLPGGTAANPRRYLLQFRYYVWNAAVLSPCETFELELGLHPRAAAVPRLAELARHCDPERSTYPAPAAPAPIRDDYAYAPRANFTLRAPAYYRQEADYFWHYDFTVEGRAGHNVLLRTDVGSRFVAGQVMMVLESVPRDKAAGRLANFSDVADHCAAEATSIHTSALAAISGAASRCVTGDSTMNGNYIERVISPGSYRLWLYQPVPQNASVAPCALYDFSFRVEYVDATASLWECPDGTRLPGSLNGPGYLTSSAAGGDDTAHIMDTFYVAGNATFAFSIGRPCHFRVAGNDGALFAVAPASHSAQGLEDAENHTFATNVLALLEAGDYIVHVVPPNSGAGASAGGGASSEDNGGCIYVDMELALEPLADMESEPCPGPGVPVEVVMPELDSEQDDLAAPFYFGPRANANMTDPTFVAQPYYLGHTTRVAQYTVVATETSVLFAAVASNFLYHSLGLALYRNEAGAYVKVADSRLLYNYQYIKHTLLAGRYLLTLDIPTLEGRPAALPTCLPFNLEIYHYNLGPDTRCLLAGEPAPASFDNFRFLRPGGAFDFADTDFRVPLNISLRKSTYIPFEAKQESLLRVYAEPNSAVDIDMRLINAAGSVVASSEGYIYTEETLATVVSPGSYTLELIFWLWDNTVSETACPTFRMQASMRPISSIASSSSSSSTGESWPSDLETPLGGSESDSSYTYSYEQAHYYQQRAEKAAKHSMTFKLTRPCNIFAQTKYRFADGQIALKLNRKSGNTVPGSGGDISTNAETYAGSVGPNRYTLSVMGAPAGSYELVFYEPGVVPAAAVAGGKRPQQRVDFGFAFTVSRQAALFTNDHTSLPATLDTISYLAYDRSVHVFDPFVMFRGVGKSSERERTTFTVYEPSTVHAYATFEAGDAVYGPIRIALNNTAAKPSKAIIAVSDTELHAFVNPGTYAFEFVRAAATSSSGSPIVNGEGFVVNVELSVQPVSRLRNMTEEIPYEAECTDNLLPSITPDAQGRYSFSSDSRTISHATYARRGTYVVDHKAIEVKTQSTFFAQIGYEFALSHLTLMVELHQGGTVNGTAYRNLNTVRTVLPPGTHHLVVLRPAAPPALKDLEHCTPFSVSIALAPVALGSSDACAYLDVVPWDLNRYDGGSALYGGPLDSTGALHLYSDRFGVPSGTASSTMALELYKDSLVSVLVAAGDGLSAAHVHLYELDSGDVVDPLGAAQTYGDRQQVATFRVDPSARRASKYALVLHYTHDTSVLAGASASASSTAATCSSFTMQVVVRPVQAVKESLACPAGFTPVPPDAQTDIDIHGFASDFHESAFLSTDPVHSGKGAAYTVGFAVKSFSKFHAAITFDPLVSLYSLQLFRDYGSPDSYQMSYGTYRAQLYDLAGGANPATVTQAITDSLVAGNYTLVISQPAWAASAADIFAGEKLCLPFVYSAYVIPQTGGYPYVADVTPYTARRLSPAAPLTIATAFSAGLRSAADPAAEATAADILATFHLVSDADASKGESQQQQRVAAKEAVAEPGSDAARWSLTFPAGSLSSKRTYRLAYTGGKVLDEKNRSAAYVFTNIYQTFDATCSGNGKLVNNACLCDEGYGGATCQLCDIGYVDVAKPGAPLRCIPSMSCDEGTCGCEYTNGTHCNALGYCSLTDLGKATCDCNTGYAGPYCRKCAKGWSGWPHCVPCYNGASYVKGKCVCVGHFAGSKCQRCSFGYTGSDCNTLGGVIAVVTLSIIGALAVGIVAILVRKRIIEDPRRSYKRIVNTASKKIKGFASGGGGGNSIFFFDDDDKGGKGRVGGGDFGSDDDEDDGDDDGDDYDGGEPTNSIFTPIESSFGNINFDGNGIDDDDEPSDFVLPSYNSNSDGNADAPIDDFFSVNN